MGVKGRGAVAVVLAGEEVGSWALFSHPQPAELTRRGKYALYFLRSCASDTMLLWYSFL